MTWKWIGTRPTHSFTVVTRNGTRTTPDLDLPSQQYVGSSLEVRPLLLEEVEGGEEERGGREKVRER